MGKHNRFSASNLRYQAEGRLAARANADISPVSAEDLRLLVNELKLHQVELELQNEELLRMHAELGAAREKYADLFEFAPTGYLLLDHSGNIIQSNQASASMLGVPPVALVNRPLGMFVAATDLATLNTFIEQVFASDQIQVCEVELAPHPGNDPLVTPTQHSSHRRFVQLEGIVSSDGLNCRVVMVDTTASRLALEANHERERKLATILNLLPVGISILDAERKITYQNTVLQTIVGLPADALQNGVHTKRAYLRADGTPRPVSEMASVRAVVEHSAITDVVTGIVKETGETTWTNVSAVPVDFTDAKVVIVTSDITQRVRIEEALRHSEERLREVLNHSLDAAYKRNLQTNLYEYVSPAFVGISGYTPAEMMALPFQGVLDLIHPDDVPVFTHVLSEAAAGEAGMAYEVEFRFRHKEGHYRWFRDRFTFVTDTQGRPLARIGSVIDITERKALEEELHRQATIDVLTGAFNRRYFLELALAEVRRATRLNHPLALAALDIDDLKHINDMYGHLAGDQVLVALANICQKNSRAIDVFARIGGDEFVLLLPETDCAEALIVMERIRLAVAAQPIDLDGRQVTITISAGVASLANSQETQDSLLGRADSALYEAKKAGRNRVILAHGPVA